MAMRKIPTLDEYLDELTFDALERLKVYPQDMPINTAMAFFKSVMRIPGTHVHSKLLAQARQNDIDQEDQQEIIDAYAGAAAIGGTVIEQESDELSPYWKEIMSGA